MIRLFFRAALASLRCMLKRIFLFATLLSLTMTVFAEDDEIDAAMKQAMKQSMENANKPASKADMKKLEQQANEQINQAEAQNKAEEKKQKDAAQAAVDAKGPTSFPDWTPQVPQFTPSGPPARKLVDGEPKIVQTGTSPLSPEALCDAWDKFANPKLSHERGGSEINHNADLYVSYRNNEDNGTVRLEAERKAGGKVTHVTISSVIPIPVSTAPND
jgi:hypothetical protein